MDIELKHLYNRLMNPYFVQSTEIGSIDNDTYLRNFGAISNIHTSIKKIDKKLKDYVVLTSPKIK